MATGLTETKFDRDEYARWHAERHLKVDPGAVEIHYLPTNAPSREIRFLEVNKLIPETPPEPIDFGVAIGGPDAHTLYVFDVTPTQWEAIQRKDYPCQKGGLLKAARNSVGP